MFILAEIIDPGNLVRRFEHILQTLKELLRPLIQLAPRLDGVIFISLDDVVEELHEGLMRLVTDRLHVSDRRGVQGIPTAAQLTAENVDRQQVVGYLIALLTKTGFQRQQLGSQSRFAQVQYRQLIGDVLKLLVVEHQFCQRFIPGAVQL
ncbi:hypothetical protein D3C76_707910 [compost metagenome]